MYCTNCGKKIGDEVKFCPHCGHPIVQENQTSDSVQSEHNNSSKKKQDKRTPMVIGLALLLLVIVAGGVFFLTSDSRTLSKCEKEYKNLDERFNQYIVDDQDQTTYDGLKKQFKKAIKSENIDSCKAMRKELASFEKELQNTVADKIEVVASQVKEADTSNLCEIETTDVKIFQEKGQEYLEKKDYVNAKKQYLACKRIIDAANHASNYSMELKQVDVTDFPNVKLYLTITDLTTGKAIDDLDAAGFELRERIHASEQYKEIQIESATQLDKKAGLNTAIVADCSASMGYDMYVAEDAMKNFIGSMQYNVNDRAALYSFSDSVYREQYFTDDEDVLKAAVDNLQMGNMTALYDAIVYSISDIVVENGAKCVIAFTDGMENNSVSSKQYVIDKAKQYDIPVYLIGLGSMVDSYDLTDIAEQTGGKYWNLNDVSSMDQIYNEIYQMQKSMYVVQYRTQKKSVVDLERELYIRFTSDRYLMRTLTTYNPANYKVDGFVFFDSDSRYLTESELSRLSEEEVLIALNELYARRGYMFQTNKYLIAHFNSCSWYHGSEKDQAVIERKFNKYETKNKDLLVKYEKEHKLNNRK